LAVGRADDNGEHDSGEDDAEVDSGARAAVTAARPCARATKTANRNTLASVRQRQPSPQRV